MTFLSGTTLVGRTKQDRSTNPAPSSFSDVTCFTGLMGKESRHSAIANSQGLLFLMTTSRYGPGFLCFLSFSQVFCWFSQRYPSSSTISGLVRPVLQARDLSSITGDPSGLSSRQENVQLGYLPGGEFENQPAWGLIHMEENVRASHSSWFSIRNLDIWRGLYWRRRVIANAKLDMQHIVILCVGNQPVCWLRINNCYMMECIILVPKEQTWLGQKKTGWRNWANAGCHTKSQRCKRQKDVSSCKRRKPTNVRVFIS